MAGPVWPQALDLSSGGPIDISAAGGFEWRQNEQLVLAQGGARAARGGVTVLADTLRAHYRRKPGSAAPASPAAASASLLPDSGDTEVYRLEADGGVRIATATDEAQADRAVYDIDQSVLVLTGRALKLTTPQQVLIARDSMEYWPQRRMAVGRGNATVTTADGRRLSADTLVAYTAAAAAKASAQPASTGDPLAAASGKLDRVEGFGNVEVRTTTDLVRGDRGVYVPDSGIARLVGRVRITHGQNQINGPAAEVNLKTGVARILSAPGAAGRPSGLIMPNDAPTGSDPLATPKR